MQHFGTLTQVPVILWAEMRGFSESIKSKVKTGMTGQELVNEVVMEWESIIELVDSISRDERDDP